MSILIVGAGPVGLTVGVTLRKMGVDCRLIDKAPEPTNQSRAAIIHARTMEVFERLGVVNGFLQEGVRVQGVSVRSGWNQTLAEVSLSGLPTEYPYFLGLNQATTERLLTEEFVRLGGRVERSVTLISLRQADGEARAFLRDAQGNTVEEPFQFVVGADGAHSTVRHQLQLPFEGETLDVQWLTADVRIDWDFPGDKALGVLNEWGIGFIARMDHDRWRIVINAPPDKPLPPEEVTLEKVQEICEQRVGTRMRLSDPVWISAFGVNTRMAPTLKVGRVFLAGDAAHVHSPVGGQGMNTGIQDAANLGWKLALAAQGRAGDKLLETYNEERHANAKKLLAFLGPATHMVNLRNRLAIAVRNTAMKVAGMLGVGGILAKKVSELDIQYRGTTGVSEHLPDLEEWADAVIHDQPAPWMEDCWDFHLGPHPGDRAPDSKQMLASPGREPIRLHAAWSGDLRYQLLIFTGVNPKPGRRQHLLALAETAKTSLGPAVAVHLVGQDRLEGTGAEEVWIDTALEAHHAFGARQECLYLIRPDSYVGFRSQPAEFAPLEQYWRNLMG